MGSSLDTNSLCVVHSQKGSLSEEKQDIINFYDNQVQVYDDVGDFAYWDVLYKKYDALIDRYFTRSGLVLDVGCGTGLISKKLTIKRYSVFGIDLTYNFLLLAKTKYNSLKNIFVKSIAEQIPLRNNIANGVICIQTLDHINNFDVVIGEISRICKKDGIFIFDMTPQCTFEIHNALRYIYNFLFKPNKFEKYTTHSWNLICDDKTKQTVTIYKHNLNYVKKILKKYNFNIIQKYGMHISSVVFFSEDFQVSSKSIILFWLNRIFSKIDEKLLNKIGFFQNKATCLIYICQKS